MAEHRPDVPAGSVLIVEDEALAAIIVADLVGHEFARELQDAHRAATTFLFGRADQSVLAVNPVAALHKSWPANHLAAALRSVES